MLDTNSTGTEFVGRRRALEELSERMEGLGDGVRNLLSTGDSTLHGVIAERIEYAATELGTPLVVVLGHSNCGVVHATLKELSLQQETRSPNLRSIVNRIHPAVDALVNPSLNEAVIANVQNSVARLRNGSEILQALIDSGDLTVVGAEYSIESGVVDFFDD